MNFGDLLVHVPYTERLKWKKYLLKVELENLTKLLFYDLKIPKERDSYVQFWKERTKHSFELSRVCRTNPSQGIVSHLNVRILICRLFSFGVCLYNQGNNMSEVRLLIHIDQIFCHRRTITFGGYVFGHFLRIFESALS
jgi:hypothetical protein